MRTSVLAVALLGSVLAGCVVPGITPDDAPRLPVPLSQPIYTALLNEAVQLPSFDETPLAMQIFRPDAPPGTRVPVIVNFSPYWGNLAPATSMGGDNFSAWLIDEFVPRGYAVVLASVRGTGESGGCFEMGGLNEMKDTALTVEWLAKQEWSNGKVGAIAKSYDGTVANMAAVMAPEGLATIVPVSGITDWYSYLHNGGLPYGFAGSRMIFNPSYYLAVGWGATAIFGGGNGQSPQPEDACPHFFDAAATGVRSAATGEYTAYWQERNYTKDVANAKASLLFIHGLMDFNVQPTHIDPWFNAYPAPKKAILGQWDHLYPTRDDFRDDLLRWFDSELKGIDNGVWDTPAVQVQADDCVWRTEEDWPPTRAQRLVFHPQADGGLAVEPGEAAQLAYRHDPAHDPSPDTDGDRLVFLSEPLAQKTNLAGTPELRFLAATDRPLTAFTATLYDVSPDGEWREVNWAFLHAGHRESLETLKPVPVGEALPYHLEFFPQETVLAAGHSIGLLLASNNLEWVQTPPTAATNTVHVGPDTALVLPVVDTITPLDPQPVMRTPIAYPYADYGNPLPNPCIPGTTPDGGAGDTGAFASAKRGWMRN